MWRIARGLYLGDAQDALDREALRGVGITHVLNCAAEIPCAFRRDFRYLHLRFGNPEPNFAYEIERICKFIRRGRRNAGVLVHCARGKSRSASAILAYLCERGETLDRALERLRRAVGEDAGAFQHPNASFMMQLEEHYGD